MLNRMRWTKPQARIKPVTLLLVLFSGPLPVQTGETIQGNPLIDTETPYDLFAELALNYTHSITKDIDINSYIGYPGEPALGPTVFMHRLSAMNNPDAPLSHHWQDATHI